MAKNLYSKALSQAVAGYSIIPLKKDKRPLVSSWTQFQKNPATEEQIEGWWLKNPDANYGIITGEISGITVVDIDVKEGSDVVDLNEFPETFTVKTPSGGYHLYYQYDADIKQTANTYPQFPHVDIRNDGGYVVGPGSVTDYVKKGKREGGTYTVHNKKAIQPFPREMFLGKAAAKKLKNTKTKLGTRLAKVQEMKDGDGRNVALASVLGTLLRGQPKQNYPELKVAFETIAQSMHNPLPEKEVAAIWNSIGSKAFDEAAEVDLMVNAKGVPFINVENVKRILLGDEDFVDRVVFDNFLQTYRYRPNKESAYRDLRDSDEITLVREISRKYDGFAMLAHATLQKALYEVANIRAVDSAADWLNSLKWDGEDRIETWLQKVYGVEDNKYHRAVGSNWLKGLAKRILKPGCKFDYVLVLEGPQGTKKSTSLGILGGEHHVETTAAPDNKDFLMLLQGNLIVEFSEGETLTRGEIKQLKAVITTQFDKFRAPYERHVQTHPRRCVFAMTTNQSEYLKDETGNRRWLPVECQQEADIEWLRTNRDQLLAEAAYRVTELDETTWEFPEEAAEEQMKRQISDPNTDRIVDWYNVNVKPDRKEKGVSVTEAYQEAYGFGHSKMNKRDEMEIANIFRNVLKLEKKQVMLDGNRVMRWFPEGTDVTNVIPQSVFASANDF